MISDAALADLKARNPCDRVAAQWVKLRRHGKKMIGPCPLHSPNPAARDSTAFECDADGWVCAVCNAGGDQIKLVMLREGIDFLAAIEGLGGISEPDPARAAELERQRQAKRDQVERDNNIYRARERNTAFDIWQRGEKYAGSPVEAYLRLRGLSTLPDRLPLRYAPEVAFFHGEAENEIGRKSRRVIHRGPAMLAPIVDADGKFRAVHMTWLDLERPNGKALIKDPESGEELPAKKVRGSVAGNAIRLVDAPLLGPPGNGEASPARNGTLFIGEGIETVLSVWLMLSREGWGSLTRTAFWAAVSLGNLGGRAVGTVPHPTLKDGRGRPRKVQGPQPDFSAPGIAIPDTLADVMLLGDGDSDRFNTQCALARASRRFSSAPRPADGLAAG